MGSFEKRGRVLVAMSGGVDSSVTAYVLKQQGYSCVGATMRLFGPDTPGMDAQAIGNLTDIDDAALVAAQLGIEHRVIDCREAFTLQVIDRFSRDYEQGITPNPCVYCNRFLKFDALLRCALELGCDYLATGHYARVREVGTESARRFGLFKGVAADKDQSYVLYSLTQRQLSHVLLPLGELTKDQVRAIAAQAGLKTATKRESQDICFIPDGDYRAFLERWRQAPYPAGEIVDEAGTVLGQHAGAIGYTIGQRKGLGVAVGHPLYVCGKDMACNRVIVGDREALACAALMADRWNWIADPRKWCKGASSFEAQVKLRYRQNARPCTVYPLTDGRVRLLFPQPEYAVAPGQAAVLYDGDEVLGGGTIRATERSADGLVR